jgi:hypothetical protein
VFPGVSPFFETVLTLEMDKLAERLHLVSEKRNLLLDKIRERVPFQPALESNAFFHTFLAFTTSAIMIAVFAQLRALKLFAFHPILMSIGTIIFLAEGVVAHSNHTLVDILGPIMQHNKKTKIRVIHQNLNTIGGAFLGMGLLFIFANKFMMNKSLFPDSVHGFMGWVCLIGVVLQGIIGNAKLQSIDLKGVGRPYKWHGDSGLLLWDLLCLTVLLGMLEFFLFTFT